MKTFVGTFWWMVLALALSLSPAAAFAQDLDFNAPANPNDPALIAAMRDLAVRVLPVYQDDNQERFLSNLSALQMVAGDYSSANATRQSLRERRKNSGPPGRNMVFDIYASARRIEAQSRIPFAQAFTLAYRNVVPRLDDYDAYVLGRVFSTPQADMREALQRALEQRRTKDRMSIPEAIDLIWTYFTYETFRSVGALSAPLNAAEDRRRYISETIAVKTADKETINVAIMRPKLLKALPSLLELTIYDSQGYAKEAAAHGYVGLVAYARGINGSSGSVVPFTNDGEDARTVINWIVKQDWSNGRVGMHGGGYSGYTAWAAASRRIPEALKAIATSDPVMPGIDMPMNGNIFRNGEYRWLYYVTKAEDASEKTFDDLSAWRAYNIDWYKSGRSYREFVAGIPGPHAALFDRWLSHPSYDRYWQKYAPSREQLARITIPVLTATGYFADSEVSALRYFTEHYEANPDADHTLVIGPYDDGAMQRGAASTVKGYTIDSTAQLDLRGLMYEWFDYVLKGEKPKPALLKDRVNYQAMGANEWRSAPSLEALSTSSLRFYLQPTENPDRNLLIESKEEKAAFLPQTFDLADREDISAPRPSSIQTRGLTVNTGEVLLSEPLKQPMDITGLFSAHLDFTVNKMDMDLNIALYEVLPNGDYIALFDPSYAVRASYARTHTQRRLLKAGVRQQLTFKSERLTSRRLQAGSRVALVLGINKRWDQQINYGTGKDVSEETIEDARIPLRIRWYNSSYIDLPVQ